MQQSIRSTRFGTPYELAHCFLQESRFEDHEQTTYSELYVRYGDPIVEYNTDAISYDLQSLIGEVGGTLGLTIGLSGYSFVALIIGILRMLHTFCKNQ